MAVANLADAGTTIDTSKDGIIIVDNFQSIRGGRTLDVTGFTPLTIPAGHVIIHETATNEYKPMPVSGGAYGTLPVGHTYIGINISTIRTAKPFSGIMVRGTVNPTAAIYPYTAILTALKAALPLIDFRAD